MDKSFHIEYEIEMLKLRSISIGLKVNSCLLTAFEYMMSITEMQELEDKIQELRQQLKSLQ